MRRQRTSSAFTLVEVLVTMAIITIILPVVMRGISSAMHAAENAKHTAEASMLAESELNELITSADPSVFGSSGNFGDEGRDYNWTMTSQYDSNNLLTYYTMIVHWNERGQERTYSLTTILADPP